MAPVELLWVSFERGDTLVILYLQFNAETEQLFPHKFKQKLVTITMTPVTYAAQSFLHRGRGVFPLFASHCVEQGRNLDK